MIVNYRQTKKTLPLKNENADVTMNENNNDQEKNPAVSANEISVSKYQMYFIKINRCMTLHLTIDSTFVLKYHGRIDLYSLKLSLSYTYIKFVS